MLLLFMAPVELPLQAQLVSDGGTSTLTSVTNTITGTVTIGTNGSFTSLALAGNVFVTNSVHGVIGRNATALSNEVQLLGATARWLMGRSLFVGSNGAFNRLVIRDGAFVNNHDAFLGNGAAASNNVALVTGGGSFWTNRSILSVGNQAPGNQLIISNGARVASLAGIVGWQTGSSNSLAVVTGSGSSWNSDVSVGGVESGNRLVIAAGGRVIGNLGYVGDSIGERTEALVTGPGSLWSNRTDLAVGLNASNSRLAVSNGAVVAMGSRGRLGAVTGATNNVVSVTGAGSWWNSPSNLYVGEAGPRNRMEVTEGGRVVSGETSVGFDGASNVAMVTGAGSVWSNRAAMFVGRNSSANQFVVSNAATAYAGGDTVIGFNPAAVSNSIIVTDAGSTCLVASNLYVGSTGAFNRLIVQNGAAVAVGNEGLVGHTANAKSNAVLVTGPGSRWRVDSILKIGNEGGFNQMVVSNGGTVVASNVIVGVLPGSTNNRVEVNGGTLSVANADGAGVLDVRRGTNVLHAGRVEVDTLVLTNAGIPVLHVLENPSTIRITNASVVIPYPSRIQVTGVAGIVTNLTVTFPSLSHFGPVNLRLLLVGPNGQAVMLMSGAGGGTNASISNVQLTFADAAASRLPQLGKITSGTYRPSDYGFEFPMPAPAPQEPYSSTLSTFNNASPNGTWSLYIYSRLGNPSQELRGWSLRIRTDAPLPNPAGFEFDGGTLTTRGAAINNDLPFVVGGSGGVPAVWDVRPGGVHRSARNVIVGRDTPSNQLLIRPGADFGTDSDLIVGENPGLSPDNLLHVTGGTLRAVNSSRGTLDVRGGTNRIDAGLVEVNRLVVTNTRGQLEMSGGTFRSLSTTVANGRICVIGGGPSLATFQMVGGRHAFANNLTVVTNGSLIGHGVIDGTVTVSPGGRVVPGTPIGSLEVNGSVILQGAVSLQIDKSGGVRTSDQITASGAIVYGGTLTVSDIGSDFLAAGDRFPLFSALPFIGSFTTLALPLLPPGLTWRNNLAADGSIEVISAASPGFASIVRIGSNLVLSGTNGIPNGTYTVLATTNLALPRSDWVILPTQQFDSTGRFSFTNSIAPAIPQRFFQLQLP